MQAEDKPREAGGTIGQRTASALLAEELEAMRYLYRVLREKVMGQRMLLNGVSLTWCPAKAWWPEQWGDKRLPYPGRAAATATVEGRQLATGVKAL